MRKFNLLLVIAFCFLQLNANAENSKTVSVSFDKKDFNLSYDEMSVNSASVTYNASNLKAGIYIVSLYVDGKLVDSTRLIKE